MKPKVMASIWILAFVCTVTFASQLSDRQQRLAQTLNGQVLIVRNFYIATDLTFDESGRLISSGGEQDWMRAQFEVGKVRLRKNELTIEGNEFVRRSTIRASSPKSSREIRRSGFRSC